MLRLASDADVHGELIRGLRRHRSGIDLVRVQDALPEGSIDLDVLAWAATEGRILITNDRNTMVGFAYHRVTAGEPVPGLIGTTNDQSIGSAISDILLIAESMPEDQIRGQVVVFLPFMRWRVEVPPRRAPNHSARRRPRPRTDLIAR